MADAIEVVLDRIEQQGDELELPHPAQRRLISSRQSTAPQHNQSISG